MDVATRLHQLAAVPEASEAHVVDLSFYRYYIGT